MSTTRTKNPGPMAASCAVIASMAIGLPGIAAAKDSAGTADEGGALRGGIEEIIVTAQRRAESLQKVPIAVTALGGEGLAVRAASDFTSIQTSVPGLNVAEQIGQARLTLRGIGVDNISTGSESSVAFNQDGVFFSRSSAALASFYDVDRVEVLRGPQGTLYGRNATGGSVNILTRRPTSEFEGGVSVTGGNRGTINADGYLSGALSDTVSARISAQTQNHSGYGKNIVTGKDIDTRHSEAFRGQLLFQPNDQLEVLLAADYFHSDDRSNTYHYFGSAGFTITGAPVTPTALLLGGFVPDSELDVASATDPKARAEFWGARADVSYKVNDQVTIRSLSAYRRSDFTSHTDINPLAVDLFPLDLSEESDQYSQELQLNWDTDRNKLVVGAFYLQETIDGSLVAPFNLLAVGGPDFFIQGYFAGGRMKTKAAAIFAQDTYSVTDRLRVTLGARYNWERKTIADQSAFDFSRPFSPDNVPLSPVHRDRKSFDSFTPKVGLDFDLTDQVLVYASFSKGFKAGTYNLGASGPALDPEKVDAYEAGIKATALDGRLTANLSAFYYDYTDLQVGRVRGQLLVLENAAQARIRGLEGEFAFEPVDNFVLGVTASYLHARFRDYITADQERPAGDGTTVDETGAPAFDLSGNSLPQAPDYTVNVSAEYTFPLPSGSLSVRGESYWSDKVYFSAFNREEVSQSSYNLQNAYVTWRNDRGLRVTGFVRNIGNKEIRASGQVATAFIGSPIVGFVKPPRTYGLTVSYDF